MAKQPWKAWHEVVRLRDDLKTGELALNQFAADLYEVLMQRGKMPIYEQPEQFFALTFPTFNLRQLVKDVVLRLAGKNDKAVRQLDLTYGGGKTHTLITLRHLVCDPDNLPDLPAVKEFVEEIGQQPPKCRIVGLCFDKLDVEKGQEVVAPDGKTRHLKNPWSVLAYQIAGDTGLKLLHAEGKAEERETPPAENLLTELLELPNKEKLGLLILCDEVLIFAHNKVSHKQEWLGILKNFFQYLTQAVAKARKCCMVVSLLASDPNKMDSHGRRLLGEISDIFQRQREETIEPVQKEDVAQVLCRRFFTPESLKESDKFKQHVLAALKGITALDEQTARQGAEAEERYLKSYPFHPDLTEVFYSKWTSLSRFQRTRGVLRTYALALREAEKWDECPLIGPAVFLNAPKAGGVSDALKELITVADTEDHEGKRQAWTGILDGELSRAREIQQDSMGLKFREIEQAVVATFLHSQPPGQTAKTRELVVLLGACRTDKIEMDKGLNRWAQSSHWLDDQYTNVADRQLPSTWRLGNKPNLNQMHSVAVRVISDDTVKARLLDDIEKNKQLTASASAAGVRVHTLPDKPKDIEDDGAFHYAVLKPNAESESGKPSPEARRFLEETTGPDRPRINKNSVILLAPSKDGLDLAQMRVREYIAWEQVKNDLKEQSKDGHIDPTRSSTLMMYIDKAKTRIPDAIRQGYCIVIAFSKDDEVQAFKISVSDEPHFLTIKKDNKARIQDTAITAETLLPGGPYNLWKEGDTFRRVKDLAGAFAQLPRLPKMLKASAIVDTLIDGCEKGAFVFRVPRPDGTFRTWWRGKPDEAALNDPALELVLPESAELAEISPELLKPKNLDELWKTDTITMKDLCDYFGGNKVIQVDRGAYKEAVNIPKLSRAALERAVVAAVAQGILWMTSGPASLLAEPVPPGVLNDSSKLYAPPAPVSPTELMPEVLPAAWSNGNTNGLSIASALSHKSGKTLPWKTIKDAIAGAVQARFIEVDPLSGSWPCDFPAAQQAKFKMPVESGAGGSGSGGGGSGPRPLPTKVLVASSELSVGELQDLGDYVPKIQELKAKHNFPLQIIVSIRVGSETETPTAEVQKAINDVLGNVNEEMKLRQSGS